MCFVVGSVLGPLMNITEERRNKSFKDSDIDLFIYGIIWSLLSCCSFSSFLLLVLSSDVA